MNFGQLSLKRGALQMPLQSSDARAALFKIIHWNTDATLVPILHGERLLAKHQTCSVQQHPVKEVSAASYYQ